MDSSSTRLCRSFKLHDYLDCMYVRIAFPLFLPLPLTVSNPTATTGSLGYLYSMGVNDSIDLTNYTSMVLFKVYNVRVETGWEKRVGGTSMQCCGRGIIVYNVRG